MYTLRIPYTSVYQIINVFVPRLSFFENLHAICRDPLDAGRFEAIETAACFKKSLFEALETRAANHLFQTTARLPFDFHQDESPERAENEAKLMKAEGCG